MMEDFPKTLTIKGKFSSMVQVNLFAGCFGIIFLFIIFMLGIHYGLAFFIIGSIILVGWMFADAIIWNLKGVHELEISDTGVRVIRGKSRREIFYRYNEITGVDIRRKGQRRVLNIMLGQKVEKIPGVITLYPGKRIYLTSDAYNDQEFDALVNLLEQFCEIEKIDFTRN